MKRDALALGLVALAVLIFTHEAWWGGQSPHAGDIHEQFYSWKEYVRESLGAGQIPYWNPYTHAGAPFLANVQSAVLYWFDLLLFVFPMERFFGLSLTLHLLIAGAGAYCFARMCGATQFPATIAGLAYALNGFAMIHIPFGNHLTYAGAAWAPWLFFTATGYLFSHEKRLAWLTGAALVSFLHFTCGHPQMLFYSFVFTLAYCFVLQAWRLRRDKRFSFREPLGNMILFGCALLLGVLMASYQLFATLDYLPLANRAGTLDIAAATEFSFAPHRLITLLFPEYYGTHIGFNHYDEFVFWSCAYAGVIVPFLALSMFRPGNRPVAAVPLLIVALLGLFLASGRGNPVYSMLLQLPGFGHFRAPAKYLPYFLVPVCALASLGLERLCQEAYARYGDAPKGGFAGTARTVGLVVVLAVVVGFGWPYLADVVERLRAVEIEFVMMDEGPPRLMGKSEIQSYSMVLGGVLLVGALTVFLYARKVPRYTRAALSLSMALFLCMDLFLFGRGYFTASLFPADEITASMAPPAAVRYLDTVEDASPLDRIAIMRDYRAPNHAIVWGVNNLSGYDPMSLASFNRAVKEIEGWPDDAYHDDINLTVADHPNYDWLNVRYIFTFDEREDEGIEPRFAGPRLRVYERISESRSWAWSAPRDGDEWNGVSEWSPLAVAVDEYAPHRIRVRANVDQPAWLRVSEWHYPRWAARVTLEGESSRPAAIHASDEGLRVIALEAGESTVEFVYREPWGRWLLTWLAWLVFIKLAVTIYLLHTNRFWPLLQRLLGRYY